MKNLSKEQMEALQGGVPKEEYCKTAYEIIANNDVDPAIAGYVNYLCQ